MSIYEKNSLHTKQKKKRQDNSWFPFPLDRYFVTWYLISLILHPRSGTLGTRNLQAAGRQLRNLTDAENVHEKSLAEALGLSCLRQVVIVTHPFFSHRLGARVVVGRWTKAPRCAREKPLGPVVWRPISANLRLNLTRVSFYQSISSDNFLYSFHFRVSKHEIVDKNN